MNAPATAKAVHTTPPIIRAAVIPIAPLKPAATITNDANIKVISVMPLTGFEPTIAIALAATVVNKNEITATTKMPTKACFTLPTTPNQKKKKVMIKTTMMPITTNFIERSLSVRVSVTLFFLPLNSLAAKPTDDFITPHDLMILTTPAIAIPPIPI